MSDTGPQEHRYRPNGRDTNYRITLTCGHVFKSGEQPWKENTTYPCKYGVGHGYRLRWTHYVDSKNDLAIVNQSVQQ